MGWNDYIVNQSGKEINVDLNWSTGSYSVKMAAGENRRFDERGAGCLYYIRVDGDTLNLQAGDNRCQNWEFVILPGPKYGEKDGYTGRPPGPIEQKYPPTRSGLMAMAMPQSDLDYSEQRRMACALAAEAGATKTQAAIESDTACFKDILTTAAEEGGTEKLVSVLLKGPPEWAHQALRFLKLSDEQRSALTERASRG
jgi:hypothetical protein